MEPWEWDAWRRYYRLFPRYDPWWAMAMTCRVTAGSLGGDVRSIDHFYPRVGKARKRRRKPREMTVDDFDRAMGI